MSRYKAKSDSYLMKMTKAEIIEELREAECELSSLEEEFKRAVCPDYKPDWDDNWMEKNNVFFDNESGKHISANAYSMDNHTTVYFDSEETSNKVCEILNKEIENETL